MSQQYHHIDSPYARFQEIISKHNKNKSETVQLFGEVSKINKRNKKQQRIFVLTDKAIYNIKPKNNYNVKRRINLLDIASITTSLTSAQFSISIPSEYDYHYDAGDVPFQNEIITAISQQIVRLQHSIFINQISDASTATWTVTKNVLKKVNSHPNALVRTVLALDYLTNMGFKSQAAQKSLKRNNLNLSLTVQSLISEFVQEEDDESSKVKSPFTSKAAMSVSKNSLLPTLSPSISLSLSLTDEVSDYFNIVTIT